VRLFKIYVKHYAPKDSHESVEGFLLAKTEEEVCIFVKTRLGHSEIEDLDKEVKTYDDDFNYVTHESHKARLIRFGGDLFDPNVEISDAYYGVTHYGWKHVGAASPEEIAFMRRMDLLLDERLDREKAVQEAEAAARRAARDKEDNP
jgi:hypothetical protein